MNDPQAKKSYLEYLKDGNRFRDNKEYEKAIEQYNLGLSVVRNQDWMSGTIACVYYDIGSALLNLKKNEQALEAFVKSVSFNPKHSASQYNLGRLYANTNQLKESQEAFLKAIESNPLFQNPYPELGALYEKHGQIDKALAINKKFIKIYPTIVLKRQQCIVNKLRKDHLKMNQIKILFQDQKQFQGYLKDLHIIQQSKNEEIQNLNNRLKRLTGDYTQLQNQIQMQINDSIHFQTQIGQDQRLNEDFEP